MKKLFLLALCLFLWNCPMEPEDDDDDYPDVAVATPSVSDNTLTNSQSFTLSTTVRNSGSATSAATTLRWYRSLNETITRGSDTEVGSSSIPSLSPSGSESAEITITAPTDSGTYYYGACVDSVSDDSATTNDCSMAVSVSVSNTIIVVSDGPDLVVDNLGFTGGSEDARQLSATVRNIGSATAGATTLRWYLSDDSTISTSDTEVGTDPVNSLAAAGSETVSITISTPDSEGTYYYGACVDPVSDEASAANNCSVDAEELVVDGTEAPALHISAIGVFFGTGSTPPLHADSAENDREGQWIEVTIRDADALPTGWQLNHARGNFVNTIIDSTSFTWSLQDGDVIRTHPSSWPFDQDTAESDNNSEIWDYKTGNNFGFDSRSGFVYITDGDGTILDAVNYSNSGQTYSLSGDGLEALSNAVDMGLWPSVNTDDALDIGDTTVNFARLTDTSLQADDASGWGIVTYTAPPAFLVINEINSEGGFGTNGMNSDFVELYNNTGSSVIIGDNQWYLGSGNANHDSANFVAVPTGIINASGFFLATFGGNAPATVGGITRDLDISTELGSNGSVSIYYRQDDGWFSEGVSQSYTGNVNSWGRFPDGGAIDTDGDQTPTPGASNEDAGEEPPPENQISQQSFEDTDGWMLSHDFISTNSSSDFAARLMSGSEQGSINADMESMVDGSYYIGYEDIDGTSANPTPVPTRGVVTLTLDAVTITGKSNLGLSMLLSANGAGANDYDFHSRGNGDRVEIFAAIDGTTNRIGFFTADSDASGQPLHQYTNVANDSIGTVGEQVPVTGQDYDFAIPGTGTNLVIIIEVLMDAGGEVILIDNLRVLGD